MKLQFGCKLLLEAKWRLLKSLGFSVFPVVDFYQKNQPVNRIVGNLLISWGRLYLRLFTGLESSLPPAFAGMTSSYIQLFSGGI